MTDPLDALLADGVIDEVLGRLKSGKEANISLVRRGDHVLAAKVYKDRATRSFKNNADYKEGRKVRNSRTQRAMDSGGKFGRDAAEQAWKSAEADALYKLVDSGVRVPTPVMFYEGVLLMELVKDADGRPAPRLIDVAVEPAAAVGIYADLVAQMIAMLCCDLIHGDLSPYNVLASAEGPTIIDFPQVVSAVHSSRAEFFFLRDFDNVVRFVAGFDPALAVHRHDGRAIWRAYVGRELTRDFVPPPPSPPQRQGGWSRGPRDSQRGDGRPARDSSPPGARSRGPGARPDPRRSGGPQGGQAPRSPQGAQSSSPQGGRSWSPQGERSPQGARSWSPQGERSPQGGQGSRSPQGAQSSSPQGQRSPQGGRSWSPQGERSPQGGQSWSPQGERSPQGGQLPHATHGGWHDQPRSSSDPRRPSGPSGFPDSGSRQDAQRAPQSPQATARSQPGDPGPPRWSSDRPPARSAPAQPQYRERMPQREASGRPTPAQPASRGHRRRPKRRW